MNAAGSPYARALGERMQHLHPVLQRYFSTVPAGSVGLGEGVFEVVGTPRRWLWPVLWLLQQRGVVFAGWQQAVPFHIVNRTVGGSAVSLRTFETEHLAWTMSDAVSLTPAGTLVDRIGAPATVAAALRIDVADGALTLTSSRVGLRVGHLRITIPRCVAPVVRVTECFDDADGRQHVAATIDVPLLGRVYEYRGSFTYRITGEQ